jgi:phosphate acyltransferase
MRIAVDIMGGDHAPDAVIKGCIHAADLLQPSDQIIMVGPKDLISEYLQDYNFTDKRYLIHHASEVIGMDEEPVEAVRSKKDSSIVHMARLGSAKAMELYGVPMCDAVLSAGNTGACVSAASMHMRRLDYVQRPGIAVSIPTFKGPVVLTDAGANPEPRASHLWQYGLMAEQLARCVHKREKPSVAVLNIGTEEAKGTELIKETAALLRATPNINFIGYIEGREIFHRAADVVVTDGLLGNTVLKTAEGLSKALLNGVVQAVLDADPDLMLKLEPILKAMLAKNDYHEHGGAPLLGVNGVCMIAHGSSEARSIRAAIRQCIMYVRAGLNEAIVQRMGEVDSLQANLAAPVATA